MHSENYVAIRGNTLDGKYEFLSENCPSCQNPVIVSAGSDADTSRVIVNRTNTNFGSYLFGEYFDCEMDVSRGRTVRHALGAFMPYNKNPKTFYNSIVMGLRQIRAYFLYFPRAEKCGAMIRWSQSKHNPVSEIEIKIRGSFESNGERLFFRGRKWFAKAIIKAKGLPEDRLYKINFSYEFTPNRLTNNLKLQVSRGAISNFMEPFSMCFSYENKYPDFTPEFMQVPSGQMDVTASGSLKYGFTKSCDNPEGEWKMTAHHSTTEEARESIKTKWYFKKCSEEKESPAWSGRGDRYPLTEACIKTVRDLTTARRYRVDIDFIKLTDRMSKIVNQFQSVVKAGLLPYWDIDPENMPTEDHGPHLKIDATLTNKDKNLDLYVETSQGGSTFGDIPLSLDWTNRLRNLKFTNTMKRLFDIGLISGCTANSESIWTLDNSTYSYTPTSCWTLLSGHCSPTPTFAVFVKKSGSTKPLAMRAYFGGHLVEMIPRGAKKIQVIVNGEPKVIEDKEFVLTENGKEIVKIFKWGETYNLYSFLKVWVVFDGYFVETVPAPSTRGQHCGLCGNFNRNKQDEFTAKDGSLLKSAEEMVENWKWKC